MGLRRRGRNRVARCWLPTMPVTTAICGASVMMLLVVLFHCLLSPPLEEEEHSFLHRARIQGRSHLLLKPTEHPKNVVAADTEEFHVPSGGVNPRTDLWSSNLSKQFYGCSNASKQFFRVGAVAEPNRYLMIATSGGLNQQRTGIIDAVVAARILNATLVIPELDEQSFWKDASNFSEIFDTDWFISSLKYDLMIVKEVPKKGGKIVGAPYKMRVPRKCTPKCYQSRVLPALMKKHVVQLTKYDYRLSNNLEPDLQKLRCRLNYHALKFTDQIRQMGNMLVQRMRSKSSRFIALHLRFEPDMLAFSGCYYGGGEKERTELGAIRKRWKTLHVNDPDKERRHGKCPLTPEEVALMLRALGFGDDVHLYVASGEIYGGEATLAALKAFFPNIHSKETLLSRDELAPFEPFSSRMAALDFIVCDESDVFVSNNNGNMARMLAGRRRYFGHKRTIRPNAKKLSSLFPNRTSMTWDAFQSKVRAIQKGFMGEPGEVKAGRGEFHENPVACICHKNKKPSKSARDFQENDDGLDWRDLDYGEIEPLGRSRSEGSGLDGDNLLARPDEAESDEFDFGW
ncbi:O-fucosyltransferase family protein [Rhynchospora pubera]|uniref:O-fucosyltransferase family protein n=1 Tax=Rhynchospora pubera TaxID=906938 RepID=A0AAV8BVH2_9POAL|nr:O-fucosyltransferase family protein [Rhynchospora pubera]